MNGAIVERFFLFQMIGIIACSHAMGSNTSREGKIGNAAERRKWVRGGNESTNGRVGPA